MLWFFEAFLLQKMRNKELTSFCRIARKACAKLFAHWLHQT